MAWFFFFCLILILYTIGNLWISLIENRAELIRAIDEKKHIQDQKEKNRKESFVLIEKAEQLQVIGLYQEAEIAYRRAIDLRQDDSSTFVRNDFALLLVKNGKYQEAIDIYQSILQIEIQEKASEDMIKATKSNLAWALLMHGDHQEARQYAKQAVYSGTSNWRYDWRKLVLSLCDMLENEDPNHPCPEIQILEKKLAKDHERVKLAQLRHQIIIDYVNKRSLKRNQS